jgi:predicted TIM-barrel fold metal-dependent hydrolase
MDAAGVAVEVLSLGVLDVSWAGSAASALARRANDAMAEVYRLAPDRFRFVAALPLLDESAARNELERARGIGAVGAGITTTIGGRSLDAPELRYFWRLASDDSLVVTVHPTYPIGRPADDTRAEFLTTGYPGETALAATRLAIGGILETCPGVRPVFSHLGGGLAMLVDRLDRGGSRYALCSRPPSTYLRSCYFDTVSLHGPALDCARETCGIEALVFGSDTPHRPRARAVHDALRSRAWSAGELAAVLSGNALAMLGRVGQAVA